MWLSRRAIGLTLVAGIGLVACGFSPAYGPGGPAQGLQKRVAIETPTNRNEFDLVGQLERRLGHADAPLYRLSYGLSTSQDGVGVTPQQEIIRNNVVGQLSYTLKDISSGAALVRGRVDNFTGYSVDSVDVTVSPPSTNATISTLAAQRDAEHRLMVILADQLVTQLIAATSRWER